MLDHAKIFINVLKTGTPALLLEYQVLLLAEPSPSSEIRISDVFTMAFTAAVFAIANLQKQPECPLK